MAEKIIFENEMSVVGSCSGCGSATDETYRRGDGVQILLCAECNKIFDHKTDTMPAPDPVELIEPIESGD